MRRTTFMFIVFLSVLLIPIITSAADKVSATRGGLRHAVELYIDAQTKGDISGLPLGTMLSYKENRVPVDIKKGLINTPMKIDFHRSLLDTYSGQTFTEVIVTDKENPYVIGTRMRVNHDKIAEIEILWTTTGYWLFDADAYLKYSSSEDWSPIPADKRETRGTLVAAANAYLDAFLEGKIDMVPWGFPCVRIEGGAYTGTGSPDDSCEVGVPSGLNITNRRFIVDEVINSVVVFCTFGIDTLEGQSGSADTHLFRVENGTLRYVHTLTHLLMSDFRGEMPKDMPKQ
jgi:hypothetical protein